MAAALISLGFEVTYHLGRVHTVTNSRTHLSLLVHLDGTRYLCDPGFGFSIYEPIELKDGATSVSAGTTFTITRSEDAGNEIWILSHNATVDHIIDMGAVHPEDVRNAHFVVSQDPAFFFAHVLVAMRHYGDHHVSLTHDSLTIHREGQETERYSLSIHEAIRHCRELGLSFTDQEAQQLVQKFS